VDLGGRRIFAAEIFKKRHDYESKNDYRNSVSTPSAEAWILRIENSTQKLKSFIKE
jgi:hypothetical protein